MSVFTIAIFSVLLIYVLYKWMKNIYSHWEIKGVKGPAPLPLIGNLGTLIAMKESLLTIPQRLYNEYQNEKVIGYYQGLKPSIIVKDPEVIKQILVKDFSTFQDRGLAQSKDEFDDNLFFIEGEKWRMLRQKLTPIFTSGKLKNMMPLVENCALEFSKYVDNLLQEGVDHEVRDLSAKYTLSVICSCAFGVDVDCFNDKPNPFREISEEMFTPKSILIKLTRLINFALPGFQDLMRNLSITDVNGKLRNFFLSLVNQISQEREGKPKTRHDFMDLLIELKEQGLQDRRDGGKLETIELSPTLLAAQANVFHAAGFETSSGTMSFLLHELAVNQDIQDRIYKEICHVEAKHNGKLTYDSISQLNYLEMCIDETLRKYTIVPSLVRKAGADYVLSGLNLKIEKGTLVMIPAMAIHNDPQYYPNPEVFDPERFTPEKKAARHPCTYLPFGEGPRHCIGLRFAKVQSVMGLTSLLRNFKIEKSVKTEEKLTLDLHSITLAPLKGIWVKISKR